VRIELTLNRFADDRLSIWPTQLIIPGQTLVPPQRLELCSSRLQRDAITLLAQEANWQDIYLRLLKSLIQTSPSYRYAHYNDVVLPNWCIWKDSNPHFPKGSRFYRPVPVPVLASNALQTKQISIFQQLTNWSPQRIRQFLSIVKFPTCTFIWFGFLTSP
jgi:hypothetical protein